MDDLKLMGHVNVDGAAALGARGFVDVSDLGTSVELVADNARGVAYVNVGGVCVLRINGATSVAVECIGGPLSASLAAAPGEGEEGESA